VSIKDFCSGPLFKRGGLFFGTVVDMNGTSGHCVVLDLFRRFILDPADKWEVDLDKLHLLKCAGPMSLCIEFKHVIEIKAIKGVAVGNLNNDLRNRLKEIHSGGSFQPQP
jgi:hypothetical protein